MVLSAGRLERILDRLNASFPQLQRVTVYANPANLLGKSKEELERLRERKLSILYYGVETGDPELLNRIEKGATPDEMAEGCSRASEAGIKLSVTVILGLAGKEGSLRHARIDRGASQPDPASIPFGADSDARSVERTATPHRWARDSNSTRPSTTSVSCASSSRASRPTSAYSGATTLRTI